VSSALVGCYLRGVIEQVDVAALAVLDDELLALDAACGPHPPISYNHQPLLPSLTALHTLQPLLSYNSMVTAPAPQPPPSPGSRTTFCPSKPCTMKSLGSSVGSRPKVGAALVALPAPVAAVWCQVRTRSREEEGGGGVCKMGGEGSRWDDGGRLTFLLRAGFRGVLTHVCGCAHRAGGKRPLWGREQHEQTDIALRPTVELPRAFDEGSCEAVRLRMTGP
jgi:hypothetical protein